MEAAPPPPRHTHTRMSQPFKFKCHDVSPTTITNSSRKSVGTLQTSSSSPLHVESLQQRPGIQHGFHECCGADEATWTCCPRYPTRGSRWQLNVSHVQQPVHSILKPESSTCHSEARHHSSLLPFLPYHFLLSLVGSFTSASCGLEPQ